MLKPVVLQIILYYNIHVNYSCRCKKGKKTMDERIPELIKTSAKYEALVNALVNCSGLGYSKDLRINEDRQLCAVFQALEPEKYEARMIELRKEDTKSAASEI